MKKRLKAVLRVACLAALAGISGPAAAEPPAKSPAPPLLPIVARYRYVPQYFLQWITNDPRYSTIEAWVDAAAPSAWRCVILTGKETQARDYYCNSQPVADRLKADGREVSVTAIDYKAPDSIAEGATFAFALREKNGEPVQWRFIAAGDVNERGTGLTPTPKTAGLQLIYRERGTVAGQGTAVQIGKRLNEAAEWKEISAPPYFVAYRGAYTAGWHALELPLAGEEWRVESAPTEVKQGVKWVLKNAAGRERALTIQTLAGNNATIQQTDRPGGELTYQTKAFQPGKPVQPAEITLLSGPASCRISLTPSGTFEIDMAKSRAVARGTITATQRDSGVVWKLQFSTPDWAKGRTLEGTLEARDEKYVVSVATAK